MLTPNFGKISRQEGSVLLEGLIAIVIFSLGILALVGLQSASMRATTASKDRVDASLIANQRIAKMWVNWKNLNTYAENNVDISSECDLPNAKRTTKIDPGNIVTVTVSWQSPGGAQNNFVSSAQIIGNN